MVNNFLDMESLKYGDITLDRNYMRSNQHLGIPIFLYMVHLPLLC